MKHSIRLADLLQSTFGLHRARVTCLAALVIALFRVKTVNLAQLATAFPGPAEIDSHYRRLQRFFQYLHLQPARVATFVVAFLPDAPYTLALDRTQWMLARVPINFLVLSVVHDGIAFPLFWQLLAKKGNSNTPILRTVFDRAVAARGLHFYRCVTQRNPRMEVSRATDSECTCDLTPNQETTTPFHRPSLGTSTHAARPGHVS